MNEGALLTTLIASSPEVLTVPGMSTLAELIEQLGGVPASRIRLLSPLRAATEEDVVALEVHQDRLCELIDGVLVEKTVGMRESLLACALIGILRAFVQPRNLGMMTAPDGMVRLFPGMIRIPDVAFYSWDRLPGRRVPNAAISPVAPDLAIEVLSESNTVGEMTRKRRDYFAAGVRLLWEIDPRDRTAAVFTAPEQFVVIDQTQTLEGGDILPGFALPLRELFAALDAHGNS